MSNKKSYIGVSLQKEGIHQYLDAPEGVEFLKHPHRHMFHFEIEVEVFHDDRDIEFILFKRDMDAFLEDGQNWGHRSCEMICDVLWRNIRNHYGDRDMNIKVSEDGENWARCEYKSDEV